MHQNMVIGQHSRTRKAINTIQPEIMHDSFYKIEQTSSQQTKAVFLQNTKTVVQKMRSM